MEMPSFIHAAITITQLVHTVHKQPAIIGNLSPAYVSIRPDLSMAELTPNRKPDYAYLAPEQTGRINRTPDERSDLYALGVIFYEMLTGRLPFQAQHAEDWIHAHLAVMPQPLNKLRPDIAVPLQEIILKLLSKSPEDRYQSAYGLLADLKRCASSLEYAGEIVPFEIARMDEASRFRLPQTLFGRAKEDEQLRNALKMACEGASSFVLVTGQAGIGKTALIRELQVPVTRQGGQFIIGKCDLMNRDIPFSPLLQALRRLIRQIWSESPERISQLRVKLANSLGQGAGVIAEFLPEAAALIGDFPSVERLSPAEAAIRFRRLLPIFIHIFTDNDHPLVLFLDDLQWADPDTLDVVRLFASDPSLHGLLVIGAFRTKAAADQAQHGSDLAAASWFQSALAPHQAELPLHMQHLMLNPLSYLDVKQFVTTTLNENSARVRLLARSLYYRTGGNALYLHRFLDNLYREKKLYFDEEQSAWTWDAAAISQIPEDPDILHLFEFRIRMLPQETIELLTIAAAIGHRFHPAMIALISGHALTDTLLHLRCAEEEGLISPENDADETRTEDSVYMFLHDRVQQAAYKIVPDADRADLHLNIGRAIKRHVHEHTGELTFDLVHHLNLGCSKMADEVERRELAEYNLQAGLKSKATTAFAAALHFLETGLSLVAKDEVSPGSLPYRLMMDLPECYYMCGRADAAEDMLHRLMACTADLIERSRIYLIWIAMNTYLKREDIALNIGHQALAEFGWKLPLKPSRTTVMSEVARTNLALYRMRKELPNLPVNRDPHYKALSDLLMAIATSAFSTSLELSAVLFSRFVRYGLKYGNNEAFAYILAGYGLVILRNKISLSQMGSQYIETAYLLSSALESTDLRCRMYYIRGLAALLQNPDEAAEHFNKSVGYGMESANLTFVSIAMLTCTTNHTGDLQLLSERITDYEEVSQKLVDEITLNIFRIARWYLAQLKGELGENDEVVAPLITQRSTHMLNNEVYYTCTCQAEIAYLDGRYHDALEWVQQGQFNNFRQTRMQVRKQHVYQSLALAALYAKSPPKERKAIRAKLGKQLGAMKHWSGYYGHQSSAYLLISAELEQFAGNRVAAIKGFEQAIEAARKEGYAMMEAIACERASVYYREAGIVTAADALIVDACAAYLRWGATAKVNKLRAAHPKLPLSASALQESRIGALGKSEPSGNETVPRNVLANEPGEDVREKAALFDDGQGLLKQITGWSSKTDRQDVMNRFLEAALRYSGAERGYVLSSRERVFSIEAQAGHRSDVQEQHLYAEAIVRYVSVTGEPVVVEEASRSSYAADPYILRFHPQSILCMPVVFPGKSWPFVLYLENNLISYVFTQERIDMLDLMITRMVYLKSLEESRPVANVDPDIDPGPPAAAAAAQQPLVDPLTNREKEMLSALAEGLSNKEIADHFGITEATVKSHVFRLYGKLGVKRRGQAIARARELRILD
ncbi:AAA family ATPase [Paenibacillus thalictri]|uniref:GAF domain-containing protein n=1 Tax=Paenibacillus thalictri TaxID=2527873 RepID=A0A4V2J422_9BACL|nr:AAA family ATPase [Paenibacillus thalictri]TBL77333.1 GAF domain-containing protein [Paenibacillus thalictri]